MTRPGGALYVALAAIVFAAAQTGMGIWRYDIYRVGVDDGIFTQVVLSIGGCFCSAAEGWTNHLLVHWSPILALAYPVVRIFGDARGLIVLQSLLVSATAFPLFAIARTHVDELRATAIAAIALLYPVLWQQTFSEFHENAFVPVLTASLAWSILARRWHWSAITTFALLLVKEDQTIQLAMMGVIIMLAWRNDRRTVGLGLAISAVATVFGVAYFFAIRPALNSGLPYSALGFFDWRATAPQTGAVGLLSSERLEYIFWAMLPLLFLPLRSRLCLLAIPPLAEILSAHYHIILLFGTHYSMLWTGYVLAAFADSASGLVARRTQIGSIALPATVAVSVTTLVLRDPLALWYYLYRAPNANDARLNRVLASLPEGASVSGSDEIYVHLANRPNAQHMVTGEYYVADTRLEDPTWFSRDKSVLGAALRAGTYRIVFDRDGIVVARKTQ